MSKQTKRINGRIAGHNYERRIVNDFKALGYEHAGTSRNNSKALDDCKVDIFGVPYNIQAKRVKGKVKYTDIFKEMTDLLKKKFPERLKFPRMIFHRFGFGRDEELVIMPIKDFYNLLNKLK